MPPTTGIFIELDSTVKAFFPGQSISGRVIVENENSIETTGLKIKFEGKAKVNWSERLNRKDGGSRRFVTVVYNSEETYFQKEVFLTGNGIDQQTMEAGRSVYQFQYTLPNDLPSSFVSRVGTVTYSVEAFLHMPSCRSDATCLVPFTVNGILDLNVEPGATLSLETRQYKSICCFCCMSGPVGFVFKLPRKGFVPGEILEFTAELSNQSSQRILGMKVTLMQIAQFHAEGNSKVILRPIREVRGPEVDAGETEIWVEKMLKIPPIPPTKLATCRIIDVQYVLKIEMSLPKVSVNLKDEIPIIIGTIPLRNTFASLAVPTTLALPNNAPEDDTEMDYSKPAILSVDSNTATTDLTDGRRVSFDPGMSSDHATAIGDFTMHFPPPPPVYGYPDLPPPTYQEAIRLDISPDAAEENRGFLPDERPFHFSRRRARSIPLSTMSSFVPRYVTYGGEATHM